MDLALGYALDFAILLVAWYTATVVHELGHAVAGALTGHRVFACGTGLGRPVVRVRLLRTVWFVGLTSMTSGVTFSHYPAFFVPRLREGIVLAGGIAGNALAAVVFAVVFVLVEPPEGWRFLVLAPLAVNALQAVLNLLPMEVRSGDARFYSDGMQLLRLLTLRQRTRLTEVVATARAVGGLCESLGETRLRRLAAVNSGLLWALFGVPARGRELLDDADEIAEPETAFDRAHTHLAHAILALSEEDHEAALARLAAARSGFETMGDRGGVALAELLAAEVRMYGGDAGAVDTAVARWADDPVMRHPALSRTLDVLRWVSRFHAGDAAAADDVMAWFAALPEPLCDPAAVMVNARRLGRTAFDRGDYATAERMFRAALKASAGAAASLLHPDDRFAFEGVRAALRNRLRDTIAAQGRDPTKLDFADDPAALVPADELHDATQRRRRRLALKMIAAQAAVAVAVIAFVVLIYPPHRNWQWPAWTLGILYAAIAIMLVVLALVQWAVVALIRWDRPTWLRNHGNELVASAVIAWLMPVVAVVVSAYVMGDKLDPAVTTSPFMAEEEWLVEE